LSQLIFPLQAAGCVVNSREPFSDVLIEESASGKEVRSSWWGTRRRRYAIGLNVLRSGVVYDFQQIASFYSRHFGQLDDFLLVDPEDNAVIDHGFGVGDGVTAAFQLQRSQLGTVYDASGGPWSVSSKPRTNLVLQSGALGNAAWAPTQLVATAAAAISPDGTLNAAKLAETAAASVEHYVQQSSTALQAAATAGAIVNFGVYAKPAGRNWVFVAMVLRDGVTVSGAYFNLSTGAIGTVLPGVTPSIYSAGNGWYRCGIVVNVGAGASNPTVRIKVETGDAVSTYTGDGVSGLYLWGAQAEISSSPPSQYIATTSAAVTFAPAYYPAYSDGFEIVTDLAPGLVVFLNGAALVLGTDYTVNAKGLVTFTVLPVLGAVLSWTGTYYKRVRFQDPKLTFSRIVQQVWHSNLMLVSVK